MFRRRKMATPGFGHVPYNPMHGGQANLRQDGTFPFCAMMQVAAADTYDDYVICRGFDPRILRFVDYESGNADKPGISVAKPFGNRTTGRYQIAEVYPAMLPTQGNSGFADFRQVIYTPPSPSAVDWRVGQNPGVVTGGLTGGQPDQLTDPIEILYDHNGKVVNWLLLDGGGASLLHYKTPGGGIPARSGLQMGSATCTKYSVSSTGLKTLTATTDTVYNDSDDAIGGSEDIRAGRNDAGLLVAVTGSGGGIIDIRVNGLNFEYTFDGTTWTVWHTGTNC